MKTAIVPQRSEEVFEEQDREAMHHIIRDLRATYAERRAETLQDINSAKKQLNRAEHESRRLEHHLERIDAFCRNHDIEGEE